jgi:hypothetical protein
MSEENNIEIKQEPERAGKYRWLMKNSRGESSITMTMMFIAFCLTSVLYFLNAFESIKGVKMRQFDSAATSVYLIPLLGAYLGRRYTDRDK